MPFHVQLDAFAGPLDLLLYLVRRHELEIVELPLAAVTEQYLEFLAIVEQIDVDAVGDFLEVASTLIEIKSRLVLPHEEEEEATPDDPRQELVRRLLEYKEYRDAAHMMDERCRIWQDQFSRQTNDLPQRQLAPSEQPIHEMELWDLVSAFGRIMREREFVEDTTLIRYDETPVHLFMQQIHARLTSEQRVAFTTLFEDLAHRSTYVGSFLAILELLRHGNARAEQERLFGEIWLEPGAEPLRDGFSVPTDYEPALRASVDDRNPAV